MKCFLIFIKLILKRDLQHGHGVILLHGAPVKSNFDGLKPPNPDVDDFIIVGFVTDPWKQLFLTFGSAKLL